MVDNTASAMSEIHCYIMAPSVTKATDDTPATTRFIWDWNQWGYAGRIIAGRATTRAGSMGDATFRLLRALRRDQAKNTEIWHRDPETNLTEVIAGAYVCIATGTVGDIAPLSTGKVDSTRVLWCGWIASVDQEMLAGSADGLGVVHALELGHLLDRQQVTGWARKDADTGYADSLNSPPTANIAGAGQVVIGNAVATTDANGNSVYMFARLPSECGTATTNYFTRWRLLRHLAKVCATNCGLPTIKVVCLDQGSASVIAGTELPDATGSDTAVYLNDTSQPEVFQLEDPTFKGQLDLLIPKSRGLGWRLDVQEDFWAIVPYTIADVDDYEIPVNSTADELDLTDEPIKSVSLRQNADDIPDRVTVEGSRVVWCGTVGYDDGNLDQGWTSTQLTNYQSAGASTNTELQRTKNRALREAPALRDVFTRFVLKHSSSGGASRNGDICVANNPGYGTGGDKPFCPHLSATDTTVASTVVTVETTRSRCPYLPTAKILRNIPWPEGLQSDGTDRRDAASLAVPQYMKPQIFRYDESLYGSTYLWRHLNADNGRDDHYSFPVSFDVDDSGPAMRITASPPECLARGSTDWSGANPADINPMIPNGKAIDWRDLNVTIAIESDQRVSSSRDRILVNGGTPRRTLVIRDESLHCWAVHKGTILGLTSPTAVDRVTASNASGVVGNAYLVRNDFPLAVRRVRQTAAFAFRERSALTIVRARPDEQPSWAYVGRMVTDVIEGYDDAGASTGTHTVNTVIEEITRDFGSSPSLTASTDLPSMPTFGGGSSGGSSATSGGAVSVTGGGTLAQQVQSLSRDSNETTRDTARVQVIAPRSDPQRGFWARLTAATWVADNRWKYSWTEIEWNLSASILAHAVPNPVRIGPVTSTVVGLTGWAWNSTEMDNTDVIGGSGWEDQTIALTFDTITIEALNQIGMAQNGGTKYPIVWMRYVPLTNSNHVAYVFAGWNTPVLGSGFS